MPKNNNDFQQYKNRVFGAAQRDLLQDVNFQNAELFKRNIYQNQINQGLSYNQYQNNLRRKINNAANGIFFESQNGLIGSSALRQQIQVQQNAGNAFSGTTNSFSQSQQEANKQLIQANLSQKQLEEEYTRIEAEKMYQQDMSDASSNERSRRQKTSAAFGGLAALGSILSFIPFTAPLGVALDVIGAAGMVGVSGYELAKNPSAGNVAQFGIDTLFAGMSLIPGISAARGLGSKAAREINAVSKEVSAGTVLMQDAKNINKVQKALPGTTDFISGSAGTLAQESISNARSGIKAGISTINPTKVYGSLSNEINNATNLEQVLSSIQKSGISTKETTQIVNEVAKETGKSVKDILKNTTDINVLTKVKNKFHDLFKFKSTYEKSQLVKSKRASLSGDLINSRRILANARITAGAVTKGAIKGTAIGGAHYISSSILNRFGEDKELTTTQIAWRNIFDELDIPKNLRPAGL